MTITCAIHVTQLVKVFGLSASQKTPAWPQSPYIEEVKGPGRKQPRLPLLSRLQLLKGSASQLSRMTRIIVPCSCFDECLQGISMTLLSSNIAVLPVRLFIKHISGNKTDSNTRDCYARTLNISEEGTWLSPSKIGGYIYIHTAIWNCT